jgi:uncharacterized protein
MFKRKIEPLLEEWRVKATRKPLIIRGARQVGKTSLVEKFGNNSFENYVYLNLEKESDKSIFKRMTDIQDVVSSIEVIKNVQISPGKTLLFIDEIQASSVAMAQLRYFYEEIPGLHVVAAGSLLEVKMTKEGFSFPVGRVEYAYLHPATFDEFLGAIGQSQALVFISQYRVGAPISDSMHTLFMKLYIQYTLVGGMPEIVWNYAKSGSITGLDSLYEALITSYSDDVFKYSTTAKAKYVQHVIDTVQNYCGTEIKYETVGGGVFKGRVMKEAFDILEKAMMLFRIRGAYSTQLPLTFNEKKMPKLIALDTGLMNYKLGIRTELLKSQDLNNIYRGRIAEQAVGRELLSMYSEKQAKVGYWYRDKKGATASLDYVVAFNNSMIPIEVKSGATGTLKSLFQFVDESDVDCCIRIYSGEARVDELETKKGKSFRLLSLPFYFVHRLTEFLQQIA